ncbi:MAG: hypothetical protein V4559_12115 [Pseudomonadota bacterium]
MNKDTAQVVGLGFFGVVVFVVFAGSDSSAPHAYFAFGLLLVAAAIIQSVTGKILPYPGRPVERDSEPTRFWLSTAGIFVFGVGCLAWALPQIDRILSIPRVLQP